MRAAFLAAINNSQTMILAPTTILVEQHFKSFIKRFSHTAINIGKLSRLQTTKERSVTKKDIVNGKIDIVIGTHSLLSKEIIFMNLKLLIIDEEHKFGVAAKEKIKKIKSNIDVLTLTATPIPRTLNSALSQIKDLSIIETPPQNRKSIVTRIIDWDKDVIFEAITREINRGGQVYYVHNKINTMANEAERILGIYPNINIGIIHGQLEPKAIEEEMNKFLNKEYDLIICTSIIESGLDIQNVNTIIINNCNNFGLSQLHQIRGRVGRTNRQAYAYLIKTEKSILTKDAEKRLQAIDSVDSLGGGLELATHDLEIRGAGEILGEEQSGQIYEIGYAMFTDMLNRSVEILKTGSSPDNEVITEIEADTSYLITQDYINDIVTRLKYYKKISTSTTIEDNLLIKDEMIDIYGPMPEFVENLFYISDLKLSLQGKNIKYIKIVGHTVRISFIDQNSIKIVKDNFKDMCADISNFIDTIC
jgi:transcription-repair coupling factor (superfamily II helicase)